MVLDSVLEPGTANILSSLRDLESSACPTPAYSRSHRKKKNRKSKYSLYKGQQRRLCCNGLRIVAWTIEPTATNYA